MFISRGQTAPRGQSFDVNRYVLSLHSFVASLKKKTSLKSDFIQFFFSWLNTCSPSAGAERPQGTKFWCHQKGLITFLICCKFQRNLFEVWFYTIVFMIIIHVHVYTSGAGDKILMSTERPYHFNHLLQISKKSLWSLILYNCVHDLIHVYSPGD